MRLAKYISNAGVCSRREAEKLIFAGLVKLCGEIVVHPATMVGLDDEVEVRNKLISKSKARLWLYYKGRGLISSHSDLQGRPTVFQSLPKHLPHVISVGRLDFNSEGLLLITNSPKISHYFERPENNFARVYKVRVYGKLCLNKLKVVEKGICFEGMKYKACKIKHLSSNKLIHWIEITLYEGKNREIRNIMEYLKLQVTRLIRISYGEFNLGNMKENELVEVKNFNINCN